MTNLIIYFLFFSLLIFVFLQYILPTCKNIGKISKLFTIGEEMFDKEKVCPEIIPDCEELRKEYLNEIEGLKNRDLCFKCVEKHVKRKYLNIISSYIANKL